MANKLNYYSEEGLKKLKEELDRLEHIESPNASQEVAKARAKGDLKENAEYHAAKEALAFIESRIAFIKDRLTNACVITKDEIDSSKVSILTLVTLKNQSTGHQVVYRLVSPEEVDFKKGKISVESPVGRGLLGKKRGDVATIRTPRGIIIFEVLEIQA